MGSSGTTPVGAFLLLAILALTLISALQGIHLGLGLLHGTGDLGLILTNEFQVGAGASYGSVASTARGKPQGPGGKRPRSETISKRGHLFRRMGDEGLEPPTSRM
jgi:hypothetical protein